LSRWYLGSGLYRNIWPVTVDPAHVGQYSTYITTAAISAQSATYILSEEGGLAGAAAGLELISEPRKDPSFALSLARKFSSFLARILSVSGFYIKLPKPLHLLL
jgi:hypothetical protein